MTAIEQGGPIARQRNRSVGLGRGEEVTEPVRTRGADELRPARPAQHVSNQHESHVLGERPQLLGR